MSSIEDIKINIMSFGYKYGMAEDANFVQDVRFLPNPYYDEELKEKSGLDLRVREYVKSTPQALEYISKLKEFLEIYISLSLMAQKESITVAVGCTGGRHRSVTVAIELFDYLISMGYNANVFHRDIEKG